MAIRGIGRAVQGSGTVEKVERASLWQAFQHWRSARRHSETRMLQLMFDNALHGMMMTDASGGMLYYNKALVQLLGLQGSRLLGPTKNWLALFSSRVKEAQRLRLFLDQIFIVPVAETLDIFELVNGRLVECHTTLLDDPKSGTVFRMWTFVDCTDQQRREQELHRLSIHDTLTRIYNRSFFEIALSRFWQQSQCAMAILTFDVCGLDKVNQAYGYAAGNDLLRQAAMLLQRASHVDHLIARLGEDEFGLLLSQHDADSARWVLDRVREGLTAYNQQHPQLPLALSSGYAEARSSAEVETLITRAEENRKLAGCQPMIGG